MNQLRRICHSLTSLQRRVGVLLASSAMAPALLSADPPLPPPGWHQHLPALPARTHTVIVSAMPSWQITLSTFGAALLAGALAILVGRAVERLRDRRRQPNRDHICHDTSPIQNWLTCARQPAPSRLPSPGRNMNSQKTEANSVNANDHADRTGHRLTRQHGRDNAPNAPTSDSFDLVLEAVAGSAGQLRRALHAGDQRDRSDRGQCGLATTTSGFAA